MSKMLALPVGVLVILVALQCLLSAACDPQSSKLSALEEFYKTNGRSWIVRLSTDQQRVTSIVGRSTKAYSGQASEKASQFLRENFDALALDPGLRDLRIIQDRITPFGAHVEFQQVFKDLPVENGRIQINFDKEGHVVQVASSYAPTAGSLDQASKSKDQATETAVEEFLSTTTPDIAKLDEQQKVFGLSVHQKDLELAQKIKLEDVFFVSKDRLRRAYKTLINADRPFGIKEIVTDANSGEVLQTRDFVYEAVDGKGQVFIPNPVNSLRVATLDDGEDDKRAVPYNNPNPYYTRPLLGLDPPVEGRFRLRGPFVTLEDIQRPNNTPPTETNPDNFVYERNAAGFEDVMVYYHIDRMQRYIQSLGFCNIMNRQLKVDAHACFGANSSRYVSTPNLLGEGHLLFGEGGVDDAEDADVIAHEYGHAIQDDQAYKKYSGEGQPKAMGEGFGDYWAVSSYSAETVPTELPCVGEWDKHPCLRRVDVNVIEFKDKGSPHENGRIWSGTLFEIFQVLGKETADRLILQSHFNVPDVPSFVQGADAIIAADFQLFQGANVVKLCPIFTIHGIYPTKDCPPLP